jgi:5-methylcytosine-specific restriction protein B
MSIRTALTKCSRAFTEARAGERHIASTAAKSLCDELTALLVTEDRVGMIVKSGLGIGRFADVPWVAVLNEKFGGRATEGYYVVFLFSI